MTARERLGKIRLRDATLAQVREFLELREQPAAVQELFENDIYDIRNQQPDVSLLEKEIPDGPKTA